MTWRPCKLRRCFGRQGAGKGTQCAAAVRALRRAPHLHRRHAARGRGRGHRVRSQAKAVHGRGRAAARRDHARRRRRAARPRRRRRPTASCSTASPARSARPRPARHHRRSTWPSTSRCPRDVVLERLSSRRVCQDCGAIYSAARAADARRGPATTAAARSCSAPTTRPRPSTSGSRPTSARPSRPSTCSTERGLLVDGRRPRQARRGRSTGSSTPSTPAPRSEAVR